MTKIQINNIVRDMTAEEQAEFLQEENKRLLEENERRSKGGRRTSLGAEMLQASEEARLAALRAERDAEFEELQYMLEQAEDEANRLKKQLRDQDEHHKSQYQKLVRQALISQ